MLANVCPKLSSVCLNSTVMTAQVRNPLVPAKLHPKLPSIIVLVLQFKGDQRTLRWAGKQLGQATREGTGA